MVSFDRAVIALKSGNKVRRKNWHASMFIEYGCYNGDFNKKMYVTNGRGVKAGQSHAFVFTQDDILAEDWQVRFRK